MTPSRLTKVAPVVTLAITAGLVLGTGEAHDLIPQYVAAARAWPEPFQGVPLRPVGSGYFGIFLPWAVAPFVPLAFVQEWLLTVLWRSLTALALWQLAGRRRGPYLLALTSPFSFLLIKSGNIDAIVAAGTLLPVPLAWYALACKPQVALAAAPLLWRRAGARGPIAALAIVLLSAMLWPEWLERARLAAPHAEWAISLFPWGIPLGLWLGWRAWKADDLPLALAASPAFAPYLANYSLVPAHAIIATRWPLLGALLWAALWLLVFLG